MPERVFEFDYGDVKRGPIEESLGGDFSKAVAVAADLRERLAREVEWRLSDVEVADFGAAFWIEDASGVPLRSLTIEPVVGQPYRWALYVQEYGGCLGFLIPARAPLELLNGLAEALERITEPPDSPLSAARWLVRHCRR